MSSAPPQQHWTCELPAIAACSLLPVLPNLSTLRERADAAVKHPPNPSPSTSSPSAPPSTPNPPPGGGHELLFHSAQLYEAVRDCVEAESGLSEEYRLAANLLIASVAMEDYVRAHSTKATLLASHNARIVRAAAEQQQEQQQQQQQQQQADVGDGVDREVLLFLRRSSRPEVVGHLLAVLREPESSRQALTNILAALSAEDIAAVLASTLRAVAQGDTDRADGQGQRTPGGIFFREVKKHKAAASERTVALQRGPTLAPLRPYQRDVVGMALVSWGLRLTQELLHGVAEGGTAAVVGGAGGPGRGGGGAAVAEAMRARFAALAAGWSGNWLVSSPTNSGKTRMFVEVARGIIASKPPGQGAIVVVLVPSVLLTTQHAATFTEAALPNTFPGSYSSDNQLTPAVWREVRIAAAGSLGGGGGGGGGWGRGGGGHSRVLVTTAASFVNLLRSGQALIAEVDLLVMDEAHHCKDDHPYAAVMEMYNRRPAVAAGPLARRPRVLAVTASPASEKDQLTLDRRMQELLERLGARLHVVDSEDPGVAAVLPEPVQREVRVAMRREDRETMAVLQAFAETASLEIEHSLTHAHTQGATAMAEKDKLSEEFCTVLMNGQATGFAVTNQPLQGWLQPLGQWLSRVREFAERYHCPNLDLACRLMDVVRKSVELVEDAGYEGALPFLGRKAVVLCRDELAVNGGLVDGTIRPSRLPPPPAPTEWRAAMFEGAAEAAAAAARGGGASTSGGPPPSQDRAVPQLLSSLAGAAASLPSGADVVAKLEASKADSASPQPGNSCSDIELRVSKLLRYLLVGLLAKPTAAGRLVADCFVSGELTESTFPKFWALVQYLLKYRSRENFHGIIFVRTRQAVFHVTDMIRRTQQLQFIEVLELIGQNSSTKRKALASEQDRHGRGMSDTQQQQVLRLFKEPGRKVLVATSAAEEGLDVPSCEFVVRYNAAATGIQLLQSRGRARQRVAEFYSILQDGTLDVDLHQKSRQEEANMQEWQRAVVAEKRTWAAAQL